MIKVASTREMRDIEAAVDRSVLKYDQMMQRAGEAASQFLQDRIPISETTRITFLIGKGNNGGDGLVMAHDLARRTPAQIRLVLLESRPASDKNYQAVVDAGLPISLAAEDDDGRRLAQMARDSDAIVDAILGTGLRLPLRPEAARLLKIVQENLPARRSSGAARTAVSAVAANGRVREALPYVLALDCPSGIDCDTGAADPHTLTAAATVTFIAAKPGQFTFPAAGYVGELSIADLGIPPELPALRQIRDIVVDRRYARSLLPGRPIDGHKGAFGKTLLVAGSPNYIGAVALAGEAAGRSGVGLVTIATTRPLINIVASQLREPTWLPLTDQGGAIAEDADATVAVAAAAYQSLLIGCGLGLQPSTLAFLRRTITVQSLPPLILDADALNIMSRMSAWREGLPADTILTPHSGEMARLAQMSTAEINDNRREIARKYAARWNVVLLLKGAHSIIATPDGRTGTIPFKTDALGTAGTGDILAGLIAGLRAQGISAFASACLGAYVHALAGELAAATVGSGRSVIAGDVLRTLGSAFSSIERD